MNSFCLSNAKRLSSKTFSPKNHGQVNFNKKDYQDEFLVLLIEAPLGITTATPNGKQIYSPFSSKSNAFSKKLHSSFGVTYHKINDAGMKQKTLKANDDCSFRSFAKCRKLFKKINDSAKYSLQKGITCHPCVINYPIEMITLHLILMMEL